uniref:Uncharacterized protein n=1 Tax=Candidatus Kentrum sp. LPFa TaxID=2126335 RepID=A0A450VY20_9GAMM|nr:MAG: hypothetical protein BECKLPF1236A_GA0070988_1002621 [Candidatus Kentron sp. LPFa]VFK35376.1 MAG: hypothetical protein BECKLPF1236C_GA0070990_103662 [Candidatus Kentron sp. LPFa]
MLCNRLSILGGPEPFSQNEKADINILVVFVHGEIGEGACYLFDFDGFDPAEHFV